MDSYVILSLVDYIQLLHKGESGSSLYTYFKNEIKECSSKEVNIAINNLIIRYKKVDEIEKTVARFIRAVSSSLDKQKEIKYSQASILYILVKENKVIDSMLKELKKSYLEKLPMLRSGDQIAKSAFTKELEKLDIIRKHYMKLQYGVFSALESEVVDTECVKLMWYLQDNVWFYYKKCLTILTENKWDLNEFNKFYGKLYFLISSLFYREEKILFPVVYEVLSEKKQAELMKDAESYGILI